MSSYKVPGISLSFVRGTSQKRPILKLQNLKKKTNQNQKNVIKEYIIFEILRKNIIFKQDFVFQK